jgi:hypothetical protein
MCKTKHEDCVKGSLWLVATLWINRRLKNTLKTERIIFQKLIFVLENIIGVFPQTFTFEAVNVTERYGALVNGS